jgi:hypothetical protein
MSLNSVASRVCGALLVCVTFGLTTAPAGADQDPGAAFEVVVSNSSNSALLWANFDGDPPAAVQLNTDANQSSGLGSVAFHYNTCPGHERLDVVAANTNGGELLLYRGGANGWAVGENICNAGGNCPQRPTGLSTSNAGLLAAANSGAAGTVPRIWFFERAACPADGFESGVRTPQFKVKGPGDANATPVEAITDTAYVRVLGGDGDFAVGDLLVSTRNPSVIARVRAEHIAALLNDPDPENFQMPAADILVPASFFGSSDPASLDFVPGTSGVGGPAGDTSEIEDVLVTVPPARVLKLSLGLPEKDGLPDYGCGGPTLQDCVFFTEELGNGPLGIMAGTRGADTFMVVTDRQRGQALRVRLHVSGDGDVSLCPTAAPCAAEIDILKSNLQFPTGVDFNSNATNAGNCVGGAGCAIAGALQLILPESQTNAALLSTQQLVAEEDENEIVIGQLFLFEDTRGTANTALPLFGLGADFKLPGACRGFDLDDDPATPPIVPVVMIATNLGDHPAAVMQVQELLSGIFPQLENCDATGARIYHHPDPVDGKFDTPENGALMDKTVQCTNPARGINDINNVSPFGFCADLFFTLASHGALSNQQKSALKSEVFGRITRLESVVTQLSSNSFEVLRSDLLDKLDEIRDILKKPRPTVQEYLQASAVFSSGANEVVQHKGSFNADPAPTPTFGDLFTRWLALAFYTHETAAMTPGFCPTHQDVLDESGISCP